MSLIDHFRFEQRSRGGCSNSSYILCQVTCCGAYCIEDEELSDLYFDPNDATRRISLLINSADDLLPCPVCGVTEWDLVVVDPSQLPSAWEWAGSKTDAQ